MSLSMYVYTNTYTYIYKYVYAYTYIYAHMYVFISWLEDRLSIVRHPTPLYPRVSLLIGPVPGPPVHWKNKKIYFDKIKIKIKNWYKKKMNKNEKQN
jgi:hypothetical protein